MSILIYVATFILILISVFLILVVLAQKAKSDGGMGAAMGGGMAEAAFGAETGNVLSGATIKASIAFFVLSFLIYLGHVYQHKHAGRPAGSELPNIPAATLPAATLPSAPSANPLPAVAPPLPSAVEQTPAPEAAVPASAEGEKK